MELNSRSIQLFMADPLTGAIVQIFPPEFPITRQGSALDFIPMILTRDNAFSGRHFATRLVHSTMTILHLAVFAADGERQKLIAEADSEKRNFPVKRIVNIFARNF